MVFSPLVPQGRYHITGSQKVIRKAAEWLRDSSAAGKGKEDSTAKRCDSEMESCFLSPLQGAFPPYKECKENIADFLIALGGKCHLASLK